MEKLHALMLYRAWAVQKGTDICLQLRPNDNSSGDQSPFAQYLLPISLVGNDFLEEPPRETVCNTGLLLFMEQYDFIIKTCV